MGKLPILYGGDTIGDADMELEPLYASLRVQVPRRNGLWCAWAVGERGEVRIGVLEPSGWESVISRRFSRRSLSQAGTLARVELRPVETAEPGQSSKKARQSLTEASAKAKEQTETDLAAWSRTGQGQRLFHSVRFQRQLRDSRDALTRTEGERRRVALVRNENAPFPIPELFCLASPARIGPRDYWVFSFDRREWPVL